MREVLWWGLLGAMGCAAVLYLAAEHIGRLPDARLVRCSAISQKACAPDGSPIGDALLPDPEKLPAGWEAFEPVDLLKAEEISKLAKQEPELDQANEEEQEGGLLEPIPDPKAVEGRLKRILQSYLREGSWPSRAGIDTMEFRPSDAKKGEFDRIPF
jgi:hypothetical protein